jgi:hypothetical protein
MKINNKLKAISVAVCCLVASLWSETQGMDNKPDILESSTINRTTNMQSSSQNEMDALDLVSTSSQLINLEDSETSWASYLTSPVKASICNAYDVLNYMVQNPQKGMIIGFIFASNIMVASAQLDCFCSYSQGGFGQINVEFHTNADKPNCLRVCEYLCMGINVTTAPSYKPMDYNGFLCK